MASQHGALSFIDEGSTRRKEIIAKFLDLEIFEKKFKLAKEDCTDLKGALRRLEARPYDEEIENAAAELRAKRLELTTHEQECEQLKAQINDITNNCNDLKNSIDAIPEEIINVVDTKREIQKKQIQINSLEAQNKDNTEELKTKREKSEKIEEYLSSIDIEALSKQQETILCLQGQKDEEQAVLDNLVRQIEDIEKKSKLLDGIPCGTDYPQCKFIRDANVAVANLTHISKEQKTASMSVNMIDKKMLSLRPNFVKDRLSRYNTILEKRDEATLEIADLNLSIERNQASIERLGYELKELEERKQKYEENKEVIENFEEFSAELSACQDRLEKANLQYESCQGQTLKLYRDVGSLEQKVESIQEQKQEYKSLQEEY